MRRFLSTFVTLVWGLWFGGLVMLFLSVSSLFRTFATQRQVAGEGATQIFALFNRYQMALAVAALLGTLAWRAAGPPRMKSAMFACFSFATLAAAVVIFYLTPRIEHLRVEHLTQSHEFAQLHGYSMLAFLVETLFVCVAGLMLPWAVERR